MWLWRTTIGSRRIERKSDKALMDEEKNNGQCNNEKINLIFQGTIAVHGYRHGRENKRRPRKLSFEKESSDGRISYVAETTRRDSKWQTRTATTGQTSRVIDDEGNRLKDTRKSIQTTPSVDRTRTEYHLVHESTSQGYAACDDIEQRNVITYCGRMKVRQDRRTHYYVCADGNTSHVHALHNVWLSRVTGLTRVLYIFGQRLDGVTPRLSGENRASFKRRYKHTTTRLAFEWSVREYRKLSIPRISASVVGCTRTRRLPVVFDFSKTYFPKIFKSYFPVWNVRRY